MNYIILTEAVESFDRETVISILTDVMEEGGLDAEKALHACEEGMKRVVKKVQAGFLDPKDRFRAKELLAESTEILRSALTD